MASWLAQRQASAAVVAHAWGEVDTRGDGCLDVRQFRDLVAAVAGEGAVPAEGPLLELYSEAVQAARAQQARDKVTWPGLTATACAQAMAARGLLAPRPVRPRRASVDAVQLARAASVLVRLAEAAKDDVLAADRAGAAHGGGFAHHPAVGLMQAATARLQELALAQEEPEEASLEQPLEQPQPQDLAAGWAAMEHLAGCITKVRRVWCGVAWRSVLWCAVAL